MASLTEIAREILHNAEVIESTTDASSLDTEKARTALLNATHKLNLQVQTPEAYMFSQLWSITDTFILRTIYTLNLPQHVPLAGTIPYNTIAPTVGVPAPTLTRLFRYAITIGFFTEPQEGHVAHTPPSRILATNPDALDAMGMILHELGPATLAFPEALARFGGALEEPNKTAYNIANDTDLGIYDFLGQNPERGRRFGGAMRFFSGGGGSYIQHLLDAFPWMDPAHDREDFTVVDVGGGHGSVSVNLAQRTQKIRFIVQDLESEVREGRKVLPETLEGRVTFQVHDFFMPQTVVGADVYFLRWILHNWSDEYCVRILRNMVPALKRGARVMVYEHVMEGGVDALLSKKRERYLDLFMLCAYNSRERTEEDWKALFERADERFVFKGVVTLPGASLSLIEAVWESG